MKYVDLQKNLEKLGVFSIEDIRLFDNKFEKKKLHLWTQKWYLKNIRRGFYVYGSLNINESLQYFAANKIYTPSYISLEAALNYYSIIPEQTFVVTSVWTQKTVDFDTPIGHFSYKKIRKNLFWGYTIIRLQGYKILMWEPEKAILDYFYLKSQIKDLADLEGLRWNKELLKERLDFEKLGKYAQMYESKTIEKKVNLLLQYIQW